MSEMRPNKSQLLFALWSLINCTYVSDAGHSSTDPAKSGLHILSKVPRAVQTDFLNHFRLRLLPSHPQSQTAAHADTDPPATSHLHMDAHPGPARSPVTDVLVHHAVLS